MMRRGFDDFSALPPLDACVDAGRLPRRVAVIGAGVAGLGAACALSKEHDVTLYEADPHAGGHAKTVTVDYDGTPVSVDVGFMVFAPPIYPELTRLFSELGIRTRSTGMSFGVSDVDGFSYAWTGKRDPRSWARNGFSSTRRQLFMEILRFNTNAKAIAQTDPNCPTPLGIFLAQASYTPQFARRYLLPLVCAIWSMSPSAAERFPVGPLFAFMARHRLLHIRAHGWRSVVGGSRTYVDRLLPQIGRTRLATPIQHVRRSAVGGAIVTDHTGRECAFDAVVFATHPNDTLAMLRDADEAERTTLGAFHFAESEVVLHRDVSQLPRSRAHWAAWNVAYHNTAAGDRAVSVSYCLNRLQHIPWRMPIIVTLNPMRPPDPSLVFRTYRLSHFQLNGAAIAAQSRLGTLQGHRGTWFCGAWTGYGFHEDGLASGLAVAADIGARHSMPNPTPMLAAAS